MTWNLIYLAEHFMRRMCILLLLDEVFYKCQLDSYINYSLTDFLTIGTINY